MPDGGSEINCLLGSSEFQFDCTRELGTQLQYFRRREQRETNAFLILLMIPVYIFFEALTEGF